MDHVMEKLKAAVTRGEGVYLTQEEAAKLLERVHPPTHAITNAGTTSRPNYPK